MLKIFFEKMLQKNLTFSASPLLRKSELFLPFDCVIIKEIMPIGE